MEQAEADLMGIGIGRLIVWLGEERGEPAPWLCKTITRGYTGLCKSPHLLSLSPISQLKDVVLFVDQLGNVSSAKRHILKSVVSGQQRFRVEK